MGERSPAGPGWARSIHVLVATDGEASHPHSPTHAPSQLAELRRAELIQAVAAVAPAGTVEFLGLPDGALDQCHDQLLTAVTARLDGRTQVLSPWRGDRHPDHAACAVAVQTAADTSGPRQHWQYPIWAWHWADPDADAESCLPRARANRLELTAAAVRAKGVALRCHRSQLARLSDAPGDEAIVPPAVLAHFTREFETFIIDGPEGVAPAARAGNFDALYAANNDPWGLGERFYELRKRNLLLACLPRGRFARAFEPGCATGRLTTELLARCEQVIAWDGAASAVRQTRARVRAVAVVQQRRIPDDWPDGTFELIELGEVGYYCADLTLLARRVHDSLSSDGVLVACHWNHPAAHHVVGSGLRLLARHYEADFLLDVWTVHDQSVAAAEGIVQ